MAKRAVRRGQNWRSIHDDDPFWWQFVGYDRLETIGRIVAVEALAVVCLAWWFW